MTSSEIPALEPGETRPETVPAPGRAKARGGVFLPLRSRLSYKQARNITLITLVLGFVLATVQIVIDAAQVERKTDALVRQILGSIEEPAAEAAYAFDQALADRVLNGLFEYQSIRAAEIEDDLGNRLARRERPRTSGSLQGLADLVLPSDKVYAIPLEVARNGQTVGELRVSVDNGVVARELFERSAVVLGAGIVWTAALAATLVLALYLAVTRPFLDLARQLAGIDPLRRTNPLLRVPDGHADDELGVLVGTANDLLRQMGQSLAQRSRAEAELRERETRLTGIMENVADGIVTVDAAYRVESMNRAAHALFGVDPGGAVGTPLESLIDPADWDRVRAALAGCADPEPRWRRRTEILVRRRDGSTVPVSFGVSLMRLGSRPVFICAIQDETERRRAESALRESEERLKLAVTATRSAVWDMNLRTGEYWRSREFDLMLGYEEGELAARLDSWRDLMHPDDLPWCEALIASYLKGETSEFRPVYRMRHKEGGWVWIEDKAKVLRDADGTPIRFIGTMSDVTERRRFEEQLMYLATHDRLTGLPNRSLLQDRLAHALAQARRKGSTVAALFLDLDRFKVINDSLGHEVGDRLLQAVAERISANVGPSDTVGRLGGDEFLVIAEDLQEPRDAGRVAKRLLAALAAPFDLGGQPLFVTPSIGISVATREAADFQLLLRHADAAMYRAKGEGGNTYRFFIPEMNAEAVARLNLERRMRDALERGQFALHYQPKVELASMRLVGVEALLRWHDPDLGDVSPATFIPVAEETGLIVPLGDWVLRTAVAQVRDWLGRGVPPLPIAVNISPRQLTADPAPTDIARLLAGAGVEPDLIELELTESAMMASLGGVVERLSALRDLGLRIAVDDFGTGYSSLSYLRRLPITSLKVDRSFVSEVTTNPDDAAIAATIIAMGRQLGLSVVAEGIETAEQLDFLRRHGCDQMQGYLIARPMPVDQLESRFLVSGGWAPFQGAA